MTLWRWTQCGRVLPKGSILKTLVTTPTTLNEAIDAAYGYSSAIGDILHELEQEGSEDISKVREDVAYQHPIVRLVNALVFDAVKLGVSDLHFEPEENFVRLRYRLDGVLYTAQILHKRLLEWYFPTHQNYFKHEHRG